MISSMVLSSSFINNMDFVSMSYIEKKNSSQRDHYAYYFVTITKSTDLSTN